LIAASAPITPDQIQPNSLDLRLGGVAWRVQCSFLPGRRHSVQERLNQFRWYELDMEARGRILEPNQVYLFPLTESLALPPGVAARCNPKSSTGRLDIFVRVITERGEAFDQVPAGYRGPLYLEVVPRSFAVRVRPGDSLAQIRFQVGDPACDDAEAAALMDAEELVLTADGAALRSNSLRIDRGIYLSVRVHGARDNETVGFRARKSTAPIDLRDVGRVPIDRHWERLFSRPSVPLILEPDTFYIFASRELVRLPPSICAEMVPFDASSGEVRTHYAGFFDSGFGYAPGVPAAESAGAVVLEVRNRDVPFLLEHGQPLFRLELMKNTEPPDDLYGQDLRSNYQSQRLRLSKQFVRVGRAAPPKDQIPLPL